MLPCIFNTKLNKKCLTVVVHVGCATSARIVQLVQQTPLEWTGWLKHSCWPWTSVYINILQELLIVLKAWMDGWWLTTGALVLASSQESCCCGCTRYTSVWDLLTLSLVFSHNVRLMDRSRALLPPTTARTSTSWDTNMVNIYTHCRTSEARRKAFRIAESTCWPTLLVSVDSV